MIQSILWGFCFWPWEILTFFFGEPASFWGWIFIGGPQAVWMIVLLFAIIGVWVKATGRD